MVICVMCNCHNASTLCDDVKRKIIGAAILQYCVEVEVVISKYVCMYTRFVAQPAENTVT